MAEKLSLETYAPLEQRPLAKLGDIERVGHRQRSEDAANDPTAENLNEVVRRVAGASMDEIDRVIRTLENVRDMIRSDGERVTREIAGYASLGRSTTTAMKVIVDNLKQWKDTTEYPR